MLNDVQIMFGNVKNGLVLSSKPSYYIYDVCNDYIPSYFFHNTRFDFVLVVADGNAEKMPENA